MNYPEIQKKLGDSVQVEIFINYLKSIETEKDKEGKLKNPWFSYFQEDSAVDLYKKVAKDNLFIDGDTITIANNYGKIGVTYNYQAYKNLLLNIYPETLFDIQLVHEGDEISFSKEPYKVIYSHKLNNPFATDTKIIGTYCIIKNSRGEFLEILNEKDIEKMKGTAKTKNIWDLWPSEMVLKSVMKRACKRHFRDKVANVERLDNENYDLEAVVVESNLQSKIQATKSIDELTQLYKVEIPKLTSEAKDKAIEMFGKQGDALKELLPEYTQNDETKALELLKKAGKIEPLYRIWKFSDDELRQNLIAKAV
jgi:hypothetical protein